MPSEMDSELDAGDLEDGELDELSDEAILGDDELEEVLGDDDEIGLGDEEEADDEDVSEPAEGEEALVEEDEEDLDDDDDVEASLDVILKERLVVADEDEESEDEEEVTDLEDRADGTMRVLPKQPGEFVCQSCFLVKSESQLADRTKVLCRDCV